MVAVSVEVKAFGLEAGNVSVLFLSSSSNSEILSSGIRTVSVIFQCISFAVQALHKVGFRLQKKG